MLLRDLYPRLVGRLPTNFFIIIIIFYFAIRPVLLLGLYKINEIERFLPNNLLMSKKSSTFVS